MQQQPTSSSLFQRTIPICRKIACVTNYFGIVATSHAATTFGYMDSQVGIIPSSSDTTLNAWYLAEVLTLITVVIAAGFAGWKYYHLKQHTRQLLQQVKEFQDRNKAENRLYQPLEIILDAAGEGIYGVDQLGQITFMNTAGAQLLGYDVNEVLGKISHHLFHHTKDNGEPYPISECPLTKALQVGESAHCEDEVFWCKDGSHFPVEYFTTPIKEGNTIVGATVAFRDVTVTKWNEEEIRNTHKFLEQIINTVADPIFVRDGRHKLVVMNQAYADMIGDTQKKSLGTDGHDNYPPELHESIWAKDEEVLTNGYEVVTEDLMTIEGISRTIVTRKTRYMDEAGNPFVVNISRDITDRKVAEDEIKRLNNDLASEMQDLIDALTSLRQSEDRFRRAMIESPLPTMIHTDDGKVLDISRAWTESSGYSMEDIPTMEEWAQLAFGGHQLLCQDEIDCLHKVNNHGITGEYAIRTKSGKTRIWEFTSAPLGIMSDGHRGIISMANDITDRKQAEESLHIRISALEAAADMIIITDPNGVIEYVNPAFTRISGYSAEEAEGNPASLMKSEHQEKTYYDEMWQTIRNGNTWSGELINKRKDGSLYPAEMTITPILGITGKIIRFVAIQRDTTLRHKNAALEQEKTALKNAISGMDQVLGVVSHELRTPIAAIRAMTELIMQTEAGKSDQARTFLDSMHSEVIHMAGIVSNLLEVARLNSGTAHWNWGQVHVESICREALGVVKPLLHSHEIKLHLDCPAQPIIMQGDGEALRRLILNLLTNASKHTTEGSINIKLEAGLKDLVPTVRICVIDTGEGVPAEIADHLGQAFSLNSGVISEHHITGAGLGLAICRGIVAAHGGRIKISSQVGQGTCVCAELRADLPGPETNTEHPRVLYEPLATEENHA